MTEIRITPEQVQGVASQFQTKRGEMEAMIQQARSMMQNLHPSFTGNAANRIFGDWEGMQQSLTNAILVLQSAGDTLKQTADAFQAVDK